MNNSRGDGFRWIAACLTGMTALVALTVPAPAQDSDDDGYADTCEYGYGNFDLDDEVGGSDLAVLLSHLGQPGSPKGDLDGDEVVGGSDVVVLLGRWGPVDYGALTVPLCWATVLEWAPDPAVVTDPWLRKAIAATGLPWRVCDSATQIEMLLVPPGKFTMGRSPDDPPTVDESPVHSVTLTKPFYLGRYEVTQEQWHRLTGKNHSWHGSAGEVGMTIKRLHDNLVPDDVAQRWAMANARRAPKLPVETLTWEECAKFCGETGLRLPTEAEWEHACRAGTWTALYGSLDGIAWYTKNSDAGTHAVGGKAANALGLHDMLGNVWEWCSDWYDDKYLERAQTNPVGPPSGSRRVLRGAAWNSSATEVRSSTRGHGPPDFSSWHVGFRVARNP